MANLSEKLEDYWKENSHQLLENSKCPVPAENIVKDPDHLWAQCDDCQKWRLLPDGVKKLPEKWFCKMNPDPEFRSCEKEEMPEDFADIHPVNKKCFKQHEKIQKLLGENIESTSSGNSPSPAKPNFLDSNTPKHAELKSVDECSKAISNPKTLKRQIEALPLIIEVKKKKQSKPQQKANKSKSQHSATFISSLQGHHSAENITEVALYSESLYLQALQHLKEKLNKLGESQESDIAAAKSNELPCQIDDLLREIDRKAMDWEKLKEKVCSLEEEKKRLENDLEQMQKENDKQSNAAVESFTNYTAVNSRLMELRKLVGQLLIKHIPTLDIQQVNYDSNAIDKVLQQYLDLIQKCSTETENTEQK